MLDRYLTLKDLYVLAGIIYLNIILIESKMNDILLIFNE